MSKFHSLNVSGLPVAEHVDTRVHSLRISPTTMRLDCLKNTTKHILCSMMIFRYLRDSLTWRFDILSFRFGEKAFELRAGQDLITSRKIIKKLMWGVTTPRYGSHVPMCWSSVGHGSGDSCRAVGSTSHHGWNSCWSQVHLLWCWGGKKQNLALKWMAFAWIG